MGAAKNPLHALRQELRGAGWQLGELQMVHRGQSVVLHETERDVVVRVAPGTVEQAEELLQLHVRLSVARAPVLSPVEPYPVSTSFGVATLWPAARPSSRPLEHLGEALLRLHRVEPSAVWHRAPARVHLRSSLHGLVARGVPEDVVLELARLTEKLPAVPSWQGEPDAVVVHGDAHAGNVLLHDGEPVLIDLDRVHHAPAQVDLIPTWAVGRRNGAWGDWNQLCQGYGSSGLTVDIGQWRHLREAVQERELATTAFLARFWTERLDLRDEVASRIEEMAGSGQGVWNPRSHVADWWNLSGESGRT